MVLSNYSTDDKAVYSSLEGGLATDGGPVNWLRWPVSRDHWCNRLWVAPSKIDRLRRRRAVGDSAVEAKQHGAGTWCGLARVSCQSRNETVLLNKMSSLALLPSRY